MVCLTPDLLSYPSVLEASEIQELNGRSLFFCKYYGYYGYTVLINKVNDSIRLVFGDFDGNTIDPESPKIDTNFLAFKKFFLVDISRVSGLNESSNVLGKLVSLMKFAGISQAQYYFSHDEEKYRLVDVRTELNKFLSPGMLKDIFGKQIDTQEILHVGEYNEEELKKVSYRPMIVKTNTFKTVVRDNEMLPCYGIIIK